MGMRQTRRLQRVERARDIYAGTLLAVGLPRRMLDLTAKHKDAPITLSEPRHDWDCPGWRSQVCQFYFDSFLPTATPPSTKAQKRFVRGFTAWCRKEVFDRSEYEDYRFHGVTGRRRK